MITEPVPSTARSGGGVGLRYALIPVTGTGIAVMTAGRMLDAEGTGAEARIVQSGEPVPMGAQPVLLVESTVYGAVCVENVLRQWNVGYIPRPWLVLVADAPVGLAPAARYRFRALQSRVAGVAHVPYLPVLRSVEGPDAAMEHKTVRIAAAKLRRQLDEGK
ncbi:hypothetical protein TPA0910_44580 [Streptomyces hygroscopicus subsp. sporocinereus]|uniref:Uncharacterized protein n=1 Tax=Streptomyces hygroscopicus TaxID=1912 RepID=A0ABQ3U336_STRHY|nr:hypothetical protein [Streptomyces hygroscopicus]GHJ30025.1 hypothetical protein TPA0910_44580 [Streptomyces hygroscopicus]